MTPYRALLLSSALLLAGVAGAAAQFPPPPGQGAFPPPSGQSSPFPPPLGQGAPRQASPLPAPSGQPAGKHACEAFVTLRQAAESGAAAIRAAGERKASREEVCPLFKKFAAAEAKILSFMETNRVMCGVPPEAIKQIKTGHVRTVQIRNNVCSAGPAAPSGPTLSDALGAPLAPFEPPKPGRGTFDTLTGNVLNR